VSLSVVVPGRPHIVVVETMLGLLEGSNGSIILGNIELVAIGTVERDQTGFGNMGK
jgi:hypothetical protein